MVNRKPPRALLFYAYVCKRFLLFVLAGREAGLPTAHWPLPTDPPSQRDTISLYKPPRFLFSLGK